MIYIYTKSFRNAFWPGAINVLTLLESIHHLILHFTHVSSQEFYNFRGTLTFLKATL